MNKTRFLWQRFNVILRKDKDKWSKYKNDERYMRYSACNGLEMSKANPFYDRYQIMWNAGDRKKKCGAGILNSHMSIRCHELNIPAAIGLGDESFEKLINQKRIILNCKEKKIYTD